jgi:autotransporter-like protein
MLSDRITLEPYLKVSVVHEFPTGDRITLDEIPFNPTVSGTWVDAGVGLSARLNRSAYLYGEYDYANSDKIRQPWAVNFGVRWEWGVGLQITRNIYSEIGYRYLYLDYDTTRFILQAALHGAQITAGIKF